MLVRGMGKAVSVMNKIMQKFEKKLIKEKF